MNKNFYFLLGAVFLYGCSSSGPVFEKVPEKTRPFLPIASFELNVNDLRDSTSNRSVALPIMGYPGMMDSVSPPLTIAFNDWCKETVARNSVGNVNNVRLEVNINKAYQYFHCEKTSEIEYVAVELTLSAYDNTTHQLIDSVSTQSWGEKRSWDAKYKRINSMYQTALNQAFTNALMQLKF